MTTETLTVVPTKFNHLVLLQDESFVDAAGGRWGAGNIGNRLQFILTYNNVHGNRRRALEAHADQARGQRNRIRVPMSLLQYSRGGAGGGTPLHVGAITAGATSLSIDGASNATGWLFRGDWISVGNELKKVTQDVDTSGGAGTIQIWPEMHQNYADNQAIEITAPHGDFFLMDASGFGAVVHRPDDSGTPWLTQTVTLVLEEDVYA